MVKYWIEAGKFFAQIGDHIIDLWNGEEQEASLFWLCEPMEIQFEDLPDHIQERLSA